jgi:ribosomal protein L7Ae-like RNA K-turn-binding protein
MWDKNNKDTPTTTTATATATTTSSSSSSSSSSLFAPEQSTWISQKIIMNERRERERTNTITTAANTATTTTTTTNVPPSSTQGNVWTTTRKTMNTVVSTRNQTTMNTDNNNTNGFTTTPSTSTATINVSKHAQSQRKISKEVEDALLFAQKHKQTKQTKQRQQQLVNKNDNNNRLAKMTATTTTISNTTNKVLFAPAPSKPAWNLNSNTTTAQISLSSRSEPFILGKNQPTTTTTTTTTSTTFMNNNSDQVQWPKTAENYGGKYDNNNNNSNSNSIDRSYLPKITAEGLKSEAKKSAVDKFGKIPCKVCGRRFAEYPHLASHLYNSHYGLNDPDRVKVLDIERIQRGDLTEQEKIEKEKEEKKRTTIDLSEITSKGGTINAGSAMSSMLGGLGLYFKEGKAKKANKLELAKKNEGRPRRGGELMANPNPAMASATLVRRGKERMDGTKKKRLTKVKRIVLFSRESRNKEQQSIEVSIEVGKVYVNLEVLDSPSTNDDVLIKVNLWCDEDDDGNSSSSEEVEEEEGENNNNNNNNNKEDNQQDTQQKIKQEEEEEEEIMIDKPVIISSSSKKTFIQVPNLWLRKSFVEAMKEKELALISTANTATALQQNTNSPPFILMNNNNKKSNYKIKSTVAFSRTCDICKVECNNIEAWEAHVDGKKHARKVAQKEKIDRGETTEEEILRNQNKAHEDAKERTFVNSAHKMPKYANQVITTALNQSATKLLSELRRFQERAYKTDPIKAKGKKRFTFGLREVVKYVDNGKAKAIICAPNVESTGDIEGGLDDQISHICKRAKELDTPVLFCLTRSRLGNVVGPRYVSCLAVLNTDGADEQFKEMLKCGIDARKLFVTEQNQQEIAVANEEEVVAVVERERD